MGAISGSAGSLVSFGYVMQLLTVMNMLEKNGGLKISLLPLVPFYKGWKGFVYWDGSP
jgi:hypothetical protein